MSEYNLYRGRRARRCGFVGRSNGGFRLVWLTGEWSAIENSIKA